jgi:adenylate cyclase
MSSDAEAFTPLSEKLSAAQLHERINRYFQLLLPCISQQGGRIADINGDAVLALWHEQDDKTQRLAACLAALEIQRQLQADPDAGLPTRIGLHWGEIALGNVGHDGHYEYRAVGETVNTTSRLETLNKTLGTRILASTTLLDGCDDILYRPLGNFLLQGKQTPIAVAEVQGRHQAASQLQQRLNDLFHRAYCTYLQREFLQAARLFEQIRLEFNDPVSAFYKRLCLSLSTAPPSENWDGAIVMTSK